MQIKNKLYPMSYQQHLWQSKISDSMEYLFDKQHQLRLVLLNKDMRSHTECKNSKLDGRRVKKDNSLCAFSNKMSGENLKTMMQSAEDLSKQTPAGLAHSNLQRNSGKDLAHNTNHNLDILTIQN